MDDDFAENFYSRMEKPVPPSDERLAAQAKLVVQVPDIAAQTPEATQRAPDGQDDALSIHERRSQHQEEMAESMFGGTPMDGVRYDEPEISSPNEFSFEVPDDLASNLQPGEAQQIVGAFIESGVGRTLANDLLRQGIAASRRGELSAD